MSAIFTRARTGLLVVVSLLGLICFGFLVATLRQPPLQFAGGATGLAMNPGDAVHIGWGLRNTGWFPVRVTRVDVEGFQGAAPLWLQGAIGMRRTVASSLSADLPREGYLLQPLGHFVIPPERSLPKRRATSQSISFQAPAYYGLISLYQVEEPGKQVLLQRMTVHYRYLGLPLTLQQSFEP